MKNPGKTPLFRGPDGKVLPDSVAEASCIRLGGVDQWVLIRGEHRANPPLILLHGGPGFSETHFFRRYLAPLEQSFTLVYWDQRGCGRSFDRRIPRHSMTFDQFVADLDGLVGAVLERLGQRQVVLIGHSWGSALGVLYAARCRAKVAAYVGSGQIADWQASDALSYAFTLAEAEYLGHRRAIRDLRRIGPPPYSAECFQIQRNWLNRLEGRMGPRAMWETARTILGTPETSLLQLPSFLAGLRFTLDALWDERSRTCLRQQVPALQVPVFFFLGRHDHWVPSATSAAYFDSLSAPTKTLIWFDQSGHEPFIDEPEKFNRLMVELVRPIASPAK